MAVVGFYPRYDHVFLALKKAVHEHIVSTIERFQLRVTVARVNDIYPKLRFWDSESNTYNFQRWENDEQLLVRLTFDPEGTYVETLEKASGQWKALEEYLDSLPRVDPNEETLRDPDSVIEYRNACQRAWWDGNGKTFNLKGLPLELRQLIYGFAMEKVVHPYRYKKVDRRGYVPLRGAPNIALLRASRPIYEECSPWLWSKAQFCFHLRHDVIKFTRKVAEVRLQQLNVQLAFTHCDFLKFFGVVFSHGRADAVDALAVKLQSLSLKRLEIIIPKPNEGTICDALTYPDGFCQKTVVDCILVFMRPYVQKHIGVLVLSGAISDTQKAMFLSGGYQRSRFGDGDKGEEDTVIDEIIYGHESGDYGSVTVRCNCDPPCWTLEN